VSGAAHIAEQNMSIFLKNYLSGTWQAEAAPVYKLSDPVTGQELAATGGKADGLDAGFEFARTTGGRALQAMTYGQRAAMLAEIAKVLQTNRDSYYEISLANSGTTQADSAVDIEGAGFTLAYYAKAGASLGDAKALLDGQPRILSKDQLFQSQHILAPVKGLALFINAFNFPAWACGRRPHPPCCPAYRS
jgi:3,4-dehydroadipyl-CoA semialdehyde dehydrogenase